MDVERREKWSGMTQEQRWGCIVEIAVEELREWAQKRGFFGCVDEADSILRVIARMINGEEEMNSSRITYMIQEMRKRNYHRINVYTKEIRERLGIEIVEDWWPDDLSQDDAPEGIWHEVIGDYCEEDL